MMGFVLSAASRGCILLFAITISTVLAPKRNFAAEKLTALA